MRRLAVIKMCTAKIKWHGSDCICTDDKQTCQMFGLPEVTGFGPLLGLLQRSSFTHRRPAEPDGAQPANCSRFREA